MNIKLHTLWARLSETFWFIPALMVIVAIFLGLLMTNIDDHADIQASISEVSWLHGGSPDGARSLLSTIAGSMISVAGVTFSITIATLSLASSQLGPRLLTNFMRDRGNQIVLGTFVAIFVYCLIVLRAIRSSEESAFVPHLSVIVAMILSVISLAVLIYFFHHVSTMIQAQHVIFSIGQELETSIDRLVSVEASRRSYEYELRNQDDIPTDFEENATFVTASASGYLQTVDYERMQKIAEENDLLLRIFYRAGDFIAKGGDIVAVFPSTDLAESVKENVRASLTLGARRLRIQDVEFAIDQLVEIAVRALSPGINDPFTAISCLDQLGATLSSLAERTIPSGYYYDSDGHLRLITDTLTFGGIVDSAFNQIRQHGRSDVAVTIRMLEVIAIIIARTTTDAQKRVLIRQADMIKRASDETILEKNDRQDITARYQLIGKVLNDGQQVAGS